MMKSPRTWDVETLTSFRISISRTLWHGSIIHILIYYNLNLEEWHTPPNKPFSRTIGLREIYLSVSLRWHWNQGPGRKNSKLHSFERAKSVPPIFRWVEGSPADIGVREHCLRRKITKKQLLSTEVSRKILSIGSRGTVGMTSSVFVLIVLYEKAHVTKLASRMERVPF